MGEKGLGGPLMLIVGVTFAIILVPGIIIGLNPTAKLIFTFIIVLMIVGMVQSYLGPGKLTWLISLILIVIAWRNIEVIASGYALYVIMGTGITSMVFWGIATNLPKPKH
ncbi:MAG: hypothetical protein GOV15_02415 [Candidatus Diapherotrites archaeon]|nr:hypothetical protein [Candidatus Diapherotrites archaeon]